jgi:hypothetical protein
MLGRGGPELSGASLLERPDPWLFLLAEVVGLDAWLDASLPREVGFSIGKLGKGLSHDISCGEVGDLTMRCLAVNRQL